MKETLIVLLSIMELFLSIKKLFILFKESPATADTLVLGHWKARN